LGGDLGRGCVTGFGLVTVKAANACSATNELNLARLSMPSRDAEKTVQIISDHNCDAVIAEYIRTRGVTRCPTACAVPTQASVTEADRVALEEYAIERSRQRREKAAARARLLWGGGAALG
jgi:hypothetical protein